ncbi:uncharacterized protein LOC107265160 [Cephus cinctus]|uniref:Uncharacterized protein LOC107265160 n=1 Tax=Cephus cinctus TaxID=211228 RepID=A0AAJ7BMG5_CEPCN|nr:uncharacterized protein LOC107265160 [Cephus cinctus]
MIKCTLYNSQRFKSRLKFKTFQRRKVTALRHLKSSIGRSRRRIIPRSCAFTSSSELEKKRRENVPLPNVTSAISSVGHRVIVPTRIPFVLSYRLPTDALASRGSFKNSTASSHPKKGITVDP